jgi:hypothetical protein
VAVPEAPVRAALAALGCALACACAKAPDANANPRASAEVNANARATADGGAVDSGRAFGLPMPQQFPHFVWDAAAAAAPAQDAAARAPITR